MQKLRKRSSTYHVLQVFLLITIIASLLAGCRLPWQPPLADGSQEGGLDSAAGNKAPTAEPRGDLPPALVEVSPLPNSTIALEQQITLTFNQKMDTKSVEAAFRFDPAVAGSFSWENGQTVSFIPDQALAPDSSLHLHLNTSAQAANRQAFQEPFDIHYQTAEELAVLQVMPMGGAEDIDPESVIFVAFNQPVVVLGRQEAALPAFTLSPEVQGKGEWLNTSTYIFTPEPSLGGGREYTIQLNGDLQSTSGTHLSADSERTLTFTTTLPEVLAVLPLPETRLNLDGPVEVQFNIRMDAQSVESAFNLLNPNGRSIPGSFEWDEGLKKLSFMPKKALQRDTVYTIRLGPNAESFGGIPLETSFETTLKTFPAFSPDPKASPAFESYYDSFGSYQLTFTTPLNKETYRDFLSITPEVSAPFIYLSDDEKTVSISGYFKPETIQTVNLKASLQDRWGGSLGQDFSYTFSTPPATPSLNIITGGTSHNLVFIPAAASELALQATNINTVTLEISPISPEDLLTILHPDNYDYRQVFFPENVETSTRNLSLTRNINQIVTLPLSYQGKPLTPGIYFLGVSSPDIPDDSYDQYQKLYLIVSENHLVLKVAPEQTLVWATHLVDYAPLADKTVSVYTTEGELIARGLTDEKGLFNDTLTAFDNPYADFFAWVGTPGEKDFAFSISSWGQGYALYEQGILLDTLPLQTDAYIYTDRPIYRPGDTVQFRAVLFDRENGIPTSTALDTVTVQAHGDPGMTGIATLYYDETLPVSEFGTITGTVVLPPDSEPGLYHIALLNGEQPLQALYFDVATYRKPEIELQVKLDPEALINDTALSAEVQADYYFGIPAANQPLNWNLYLDDADFFLPGYQVGPLDITWLAPRLEGYNPLGVVAASGEDKTDAEGHLSLTFSSQQLQGDNLSAGQLKNLTVEATLTDESGFPISARDSVLRHPEEFYIGVQPEAYSGIEDFPFNFSIQTVDWDRNPVGQLPLKATFESIQWDIVETRNPEEPIHYVPETSFIASANPITGADGKARLAFTPPAPGTYRLTVESGNALTQTLVWVSGSSAAIWPRQSQNIVTLIPDAEAYQPGQTAQIFIPNPFPRGAKALVTVERARVMESQILEINGAGYSLQLPLTEKALPNVYVSVILLGKTPKGDPDYRQGMLNLPVTPIQKTLQVSLILDPTRTTPGEMVTATLTVTDSQGEPVQGEFSVAVVDKALLALIEPNSPPILDALYGNRPLSVQTSASLKTYATKLTLSSLGMGQGGGGGDMQPLAEIREDFPDTAFWKGTVVTGADGTALITIPLPDSLTTWTVDVRGLTKTFQVGQAEAQIVTQKELMIRPITPRFLVADDDVEMAAVVHNNSAQTLEVDVSLQGVGFSPSEETRTNQTVTLQPAEQVRVSWWGKVNNVDSVDLVFRATSGSLHDASTPIWGTLPVLRYLTPYTFSTSGQLTEAGQRLELVSLPISSEPSAGTLKLELAHTLTTKVFSSLAALEATPYSDTVSILSRLLANLNAYLTLKHLEVDSPQMEANLLNVVNEGLRQLLEGQNFDGGWSWWPEKFDFNAASDPFISAYVLLGLTQAADAGWEVNEYYLERTKEFLSTQLTQPSDLGTVWELDQLVFETYALRQSNLELGMILEGLYARRSELSPWAKALLALTLHDSGEKRTQVITLLSDLEADAIRSATGIHWESGHHSWVLPGSPLFNTAVGVYTLAQLDPASTSLGMALRYLLANQHSSNLWASPLETAWSLKAISAALQGTGDYQADFDFQAALNGTVIAEGTASGRDTLQPIMVSSPIEDLYPSSPNALEIERGEGSGTLYFRADLQTYQSAATAEAINQGISLSRAYYQTGEGCPGGEDCLPLNAIALTPEGTPPIITVAVTVILSSDMHHLIIEDFIPSGTEVLSQKFLTSQTLGLEPIADFNPRSPFTNGWGWWYFSKPQIYDNHVLWSTEYVPAGTYTLTYQILPFQRGVYQVLPSHAWQYFFPEVQGTSAGGLFTIE